MQMSCGQCSPGAVQTPQLALQQTCPTSQLTGPQRMGAGASTTITRIRDLCQGWAEEAKDPLG
jgi:hypothetical protein